MVLSFDYVNVWVYQDLQLVSQSKDSAFPNLGRAADVFNYLSGFSTHESSFFNFSGRRFPKYFAEFVDEI
ncbi:MAG: hypothetical protein HOM18_03470 [Candidatus Marinimicrobia bacterium]|nr:hypothetical protein [Candidatus Neomarinimicrobiota bacterium]